MGQGARANSPDISAAIGRPRVFKVLLLDRYILREFLVSFAAVMAFCALLTLVASIFDKFGDIFQNDPPARAIVGYFACSLPAALVKITPMAAMIAVLFSIGAMARTNEIVALMTSGVNATRIAAPVLFGGLLVAMGTFAANEALLPPLNRKAKEFALLLERRDEVKASTRNDLVARGRGNRYYLMRVYVAAENRMVKPLIVELDQSGEFPTSRVEAESAVLADATPGAGVTKWTFDSPRRWRYGADGRVTEYEATTGPVTLELEDRLPELLARPRTADEMNFAEMRDYIGVLEQRGQPTAVFVTDLWVKVLFPAGILVVVAIGFSFAVRTRGGTAVSMFGYGVVWAFLYYFATALGQALGHAGKLPPVVAAVAPAGAFAIVAVRAIRKSGRWYT